MKEGTNTLQLTRLELGAHAGNHPPESLHTDLEDLGHRTYCIPTQAQTQILVCGLYERCGFV